MPQMKSPTGRPTPKIVQIYWSSDNTGFRIWNASWPSDTFERVDLRTFDALVATFNRFGIPVEEYFEND